ncbi:MAG: glutamine--tRNA ligase, partial [Clostridiales bacterium]|nr:glutamine--tRNA ligase [Clostridiales bacterium]
MALDASHFNNLKETGAFIHNYIKADLGDNTERIKTRFPPEPNGYLHIGNMKGVYINYGFSKIYGGTFNLRMDDTNPSREDTEFVESIKEDIRWMGFDWEDRFFYASDYFDICYERAIKLIKNGKAFVCDLTAEELHDSRGSLTAPGKESPYRNRSVEENLNLFERMKSGEFPDGSRTLRAKIDMASPNMNLRDPVLYRIAHVNHHNTGDKWKIYPMYDYAHPIQDAVEGITHSMCSLEFEDHRPLYNWVVDELEFEHKPRQVEFTKIYVSNTVMGKRYLRKLVETGQVDGWDDPRMVTVAGMRRRGYAPEAIVQFLDMTGVSKGVNKIDFASLEHCVREHLKTRAKVVMAVLDPIRVTITN